MFTLNKNIYILSLISIVVRVLFSTPCICALNKNISHEIKTRA